jgi:hypothetical protein
MVSEKPEALDYDGIEALNDSTLHRAAERGHQATDK